MNRDSVDLGHPTLSCTFLPLLGKLGNPWVLSRARPDAQTPPMAMPNIPWLTRTEQATMERLLLTTLLLPLLAVDSATSNLEGQSLLFPWESATDYVLLTPQQQKPLHNFTLCMKAFSDLTRGYSLLSYATRSHSNALLLHVNRPGEFSLSIGDSEIVFRTPQSWQGPSHVCVSWESATGIATLWMNGWILGRKGVNKGYVLEGEASIILGQDQDSFGGGFEAKQSLVGEVWDVRLWDRVMNITDVLFTHENSNLLDWHSLTFRSFGDVVIKPKLWL
ncbi:mucosal pentraxin-like [Sorex fumeus]|uniref:mucosal pentraxin-like n=1 Tax=Sorex fumeus TaxID=62283 RepID=UPI0024AD37CD|nr:mucosal pentraxin-like [Sorex fumeus]